MNIITATELYQIADAHEVTPKFIRQTPVDDTGHYTMTWEIDDLEYVTLNKLGL